MLRREEIQNEETTTRRFSLPQVDSLRSSVLVLGGSELFGPANSYPPKDTQSRRTTIPSVLTNNIFQYEVPPTDPIQPDDNVENLSEHDLEEADYDFPSSFIDADEAERMVDASAGTALGRSTSQITYEEMLECRVESMDAPDVVHSNDEWGSYEVFEIIHVPTGEDEHQNSIGQPPKSQAKAKTKRRGLNFLRLFGLSEPEPVSTSDPPSVQSQTSQEEANPSSGAMKVTVMNKLHSMWNNVKFGGWTIQIRPNFSPNSPIFLLGKIYVKYSQDDERRKFLKDSFELFLEDFASRIWFTYRTSFPPIGIEDKQLLQSTTVESSTHARPSFESQRSMPSHRLLTPDRASGSLHSHRVSLPISNRSREEIGAPPRPQRIPSAPVVTTSDCGWGCMLRCGQMMMAQALMLHFLGRDWTCYNKPSGQCIRLYKQIVRWFGDALSPSTPFSIHQMVQLSGQKPGSWFGPATVCRLLQLAHKEAATVEPRLNELSVHVVEDSTLYRQDLLDLMGFPSKSRTSPSVSSRMSFRSMEVSMPSGEWADSSTGGIDEGVDACTLDSAQHPVTRSLLILIPLHLGGAERVNEDVYGPVLKRMLSETNCVGVVGGRPRHSVYMVGWQDDRLVYLDPHFSQPTIDHMPPTFSTQTYRCVFPKKIALKKLDPSCAIGFYCRTRQDLERWLQLAATELTSNSAYPLIQVLEGSRSPPGEVNQGVEKHLRIHSVTPRSGSTSVSEFILL